MSTLPDVAPWNDPQACFYVHEVVGSVHTRWFVYFGDPKAQTGFAIQNEFQAPWGGWREPRGALEQALRWNEEYGLGSVYHGGARRRASVVEVQAEAMPEEPTTYQLRQVGPRSWGVVALPAEVPVFVADNRKRAERYLTTAVRA